MEASGLTKVNLLKRTIQQTELVLVWFGGLMYSGVE